MQSSQQTPLFDEHSEKEHSPVECLGMTFANDEARRGYFIERLREKLQAPEFRKIEGFPIGEDEDILRLSDPPYYTACPNPFLPEIIAAWQQERQELRKQLGLPDDSPLAHAGEAPGVRDYQREPFAADVSEGKNDPIYNAHSYHTKVPHKAIMRYILHYTDPGDIVFDGFCGTGMTGVAAQLCGDKKAVESLGYRVDADGWIFEINREGQDKQDKEQKPISRLGARKAVLNDLSPAATFIAYNYNTPVDAAAFEREAKRILQEVEQECGWMYETWHIPPPSANVGKAASREAAHPSPNVSVGRGAGGEGIKGKINYTVWSDVFVCPQCGKEMAFWDVAVDKEAGGIREAWNCPGCAARLAKRPRKDSGALKAERAWETRFDRELKKTIRQTRQVPVLINYSLGKKRYEKKPDVADLELIHEIEESDIPYPFPTNQMSKGDKTSDPFNLGITHLQHFYTRRNLRVLAAIYSKQKNLKHLLWFNSQLINISKLNRYRPSVSFPYNPFSGTLYISSQVSEANVFTAYKNKIERMKKAFIECRFGNYIGCIQSSSHQIANQINFLDYIFVDPPFGSNLMYSELNFLWESWLKVLTNNQPEAIMNNVQHKGLTEYQQIMQGCFNEFYRVLKPGRWMTIEFHNSQNAVWNAIQEALQRAGFVIADVRVLDKQQGSFNQATSSGAVKQDLIISAYKPNGNLEENFRLKAGSEEGVWEFVRYHLGKLPVTNQANGSAVVNAERQAFLLFDRMVAFHIQRGVMVPISSPEFYAGLEQRFTRRDGMYFLPDQVGEYDRALLNSGKPTQIPLFVTDEKTAITWLRQQLDPASGGEPQTRGDLTNQFNQTMHRAKHETALELIEILEQNFLQDETGKWYVPDHNKASDLEKVRRRSLLREFAEYAAGQGRLRQFRTETVRAGFADCFRKQDFPTLIRVAERLPENVLREDPDLLMYYDSAMLRRRN